MCVCVCVRVRALARASALCVHAHQPLFIILDIPDNLWYLFDICFTVSASSLLHFVFVCVFVPDTLETVIFRHQSLCVVVYR